jgi:hypothetical protein
MDDSLFIFVDGLCFMDGKKDFDLKIKNGNENERESKGESPERTTLQKSNAIMSNK